MDEFGTKPSDPIGPERACVDRVSREIGDRVGEAMATTLFGLSVGILTLVFYSLTKARATKTLADAEQAVHMIADHIKRDEKPSAVSALHAGRPPLRD